MYFIHQLACLRNSADTEFRTFVSLPDIPYVIYVVIAQYSAEFRVTEFDKIPGTPLLFLSGNSAHV
jgi:hypothetical protein